MVQDQRITRVQFLAILLAVGVLVGVARLQVCDAPLIAEERLAATGPAARVAGGTVPAAMYLPGAFLPETVERRPECVRWVAVGLSTLGATALFLAARRLYGPGAACAALALWCFSPLVTGEAGLYLPETLTAAFFLVALYAGAVFAGRPEGLHALAFGLALGLLLCSGFAPALSLAIFLVLAVALASPRNRARLWLLVSVAVAAGFLCAMCQLPEGTASGGLRRYGSELVARGAPVYFLGRYCDVEPLHYCPVLFVSKCPIPLLLLVLFGLVAARRRRSEWLLLAAPLAVAAGAVAGANSPSPAGLLPLMASAVLLAASPFGALRERWTAGWSGRLWRAGFPAVLGWSVVELALTIPDPIAYCSPLSLHAKEPYKLFLRREIVPLYSERILKELDDRRSDVRVLFAKRTEGSFESGGVRANEVGWIAPRRGREVVREFLLTERVTDLTGCGGVGSPALAYFATGQLGIDVASLVGRSDSERIYFDWLIEHFRPTGSIGGAFFFFEVPEGALKAVIEQADSFEYKAAEAYRLLKLGRLEDAVRLGQEAAGIRPAVRRIHDILYDAFTEMGQHERAGEQLAICHKLQPDDVQTARLLAEFYRSRGKDREALNALATCVTYNPPAVEIQLLLFEYASRPHLRRAAAMMAAERWTDALALLLAGEAGGTSLEWVRELDLALVLRKLGKESESRRHRERALQLNPPLRSPAD